MRRTDETVNYLGESPFSIINTADLNPLLLIGSNKEKRETEETEFSNLDYQADIDNMISNQPICGPNPVEA